MRKNEKEKREKDEERVFVFLWEEKERENEKRPKMRKVGEKRDLAGEELEKEHICRLGTVSGDS